MMIAAIIPATIIQLKKLSDTPEPKIDAPSPDDPPINSVVSRAVRLRADPPDVSNDKRAVDDNDCPSRCDPVARASIVMVRLLPAAISPIASVTRLSPLSTSPRLVRWMVTPSGSSTERVAFLIASRASYVTVYVTRSLRSIRVALSVIERRAYVLTAVPVDDDVDALPEVFDDDEFEEPLFDDDPVELLPVFWLFDDPDEELLLFTEEAPDCPEPDVLSDETVVPSAPVVNDLVSPTSRTPSAYPIAR